MRMKRRTAAMKEHLRAATSIANEMNKSCHRTCTFAHVSRPVNPTAKMLLGSGSSSRSPHLMLLNMDRPFFPISSPPLDPVPSSFSFSPSLSCCFKYESDGSFGDLGLGFEEQRSRREIIEVGMWYCGCAGIGIGNGIGGCERVASRNMFPAHPNFQENDERGNRVLSPGFSSTFSFLFLRGWIRWARKAFYRHL
ncbi:hypothetical protein M0R45_035819 [Rubus argutus]|uniref:Uncharacterized protein n=1 Tax=Rubus argutus TaxID=59490 RepID=A0AAW1VVS4_RUBAR